MSHYTYSCRSKFVGPRTSDLVGRTKSEEEELSDDDLSDDNLSDDELSDDDSFGVAFIATVVFISPFLGGSSSDDELSDENQKKRIII